jgi:hypothetical protein
VAYAVSMTLIMAAAWAPRGFLRGVRRVCIR